MSLSDQNRTSSSTATASTLGRYKILRVIAKSNDVVYEALDPGINRRIAVKELSLSTNVSGQQRRERIERFYREAKAAGNLNHANIVTVFEVGNDGDRHYIAMEYLEGPSLRDILRIRGALPIKEAFNITLQLTDALGYAHSQGVVHRDVKPDNIHVILPNDTVKLTDFGIARILADPSITSTGQVFGTPSYMSPEQILSKDVDHRSDIFSLGVVLFEMIVGKKPFVGDSVITITYHVMNSPAPIPTTLPSGVFNILSRALSKDPKQRYATMADLAADIHNELAFSDSPYNFTAHPNVPTNNQFNDEHTSMLDPIELFPSTQAPPASATNYAPATGIRDAIAGGPVAAATTVSPAVLPIAPTPVESSKGAAALIGSIFGVMVVVLSLVLVIAKAYVSSRVNDQKMIASRVYSKAGSELLAHDYDDAMADYKTALAEAPKGSDVAIYSASAIAQIKNREAELSDTIPQIDTSTSSPVAPTLTVPGQVTAPTTVTPPVLNPDDSAASDLQTGEQDLARGDENDAITAFAAANSADPTGNAGKKAGTQLAQIYSDMGDQALQTGHSQAALQDWQLVVKYAPADPLADAARQKILQNGTPGGTLGQQSPTSGQQSVQSNQ